MQKAFWQQKWQENQIGFHLPEAHPLLQKYHAEVFSNQATLFVPLCGKSRDLKWLANAGYSVVGNELSEIAVKDFYRENYELNNDDLETIVQTDGNESLHCYQYESIEILQGDFFKLQPSHLSTCTGIYDRAALIALPESMRLEYVGHMRQLFSNAQLLLITLDYQQEQMAGPPFSVTQSEVENLFGWANVEQLWRRDIIEKEPRFKARGLEYFYESAYRINWS